MNKEEIKELLKTAEGVEALKEFMNEDASFRVTPKGFMEAEFGSGAYDILKEHAQEVIGEPSESGVPAVILTEDGGEWTEMAKVDDKFTGAHEV